MTSAPAGNSLQRVNARITTSIPRTAGTQINVGRANAGAAAWAFTHPAPKAPRVVEAQAEQPKVTRSKFSNRKIASLRRAERHRLAAIRRLASKSRDVSLQRDVEMPAPNAAVPASPAGSIPAMVTAEARRAGVNPALAHAVVKVESRYQPNATGAGGYVGLMQLSYRTAQGMGFKGSRKALYEPSNNLTYGMRYLAQAVRLANGNTCGAVSKYQGGHGVRGVTRAGAVYCAKVRRFMAEGIPASGKVAAN